MLSIDGIGAFDLILEVRCWMVLRSVAGGAPIRVAIFMAIRLPIFSTTMLATHEIRQGRRRRGW